jgi:hypothetical protein
MSEDDFKPDRTMFEEVAALTLRVARPLIWHDKTEGWPKVLDGGTCFLLRFDEGIVGVTANHVVAAFEDAVVKNPNVVCQLRTVLFDLRTSSIDRDEDLDIATFRVSEAEAAGTEATVLDCRGNWPPPMPDAMRALSICGYPEHMRVTAADRSAEFQAWGALAAVESTTDREILITYDPARDRSSRWAMTLPPLGLNLSGCSGGPVLMHGTRNGLHRWFPVAMVIAGPKDGKQGLFTDIDLIRLRRIHIVQPDGSISRP